MSEGLSPQFSRPVSDRIDGRSAETRPLRVALVTSDGLSGRGGIGRVMTYLSRQIAQAHPEIRILPCRARLSQRPLLKHATVPFALMRFALMCWVRRIDVVHINVAPRGSTWRKMLYARTAQRLGRPVILHLHGSGYDEFFAGLNPGRKARARNLFQQASAVVTLGPGWTCFASSELGVAADRIWEIPNGVPAAPPGPSPRNPEPVIAALGVIGRRKGTDVLLNALAELSAQGIAWRAVIGGDGDVAAAREQARTLGIDGQVAFPGWLDEAGADDALRSADIFVLPSRAENQPVSILEAMARGLPVVATTVGAIPDQVAAERSGLLVPPEDVDALADALARLIAAPDLRREYGEAGRQRFAARFSLEACAERFVRLYRALA